MPDEQSEARAVAPSPSPGASPVTEAAPAAGTVQEPAAGPAAADAETGLGDEHIALASQRQLIWRRFRKHKLALVGAVVVILFYVVAAGADFFAYASPNAADANATLVPPQGIALHMHPLRQYHNPDTLQTEYAPDTSQTYSLRLFAPGYHYKLFGLIPTDIHLLGTSGPPGQRDLYVLGTDQQGQDVYSQLMLATRTSLLIGLLAVAISVVLGVLLGGISGYYGGWVDTVIQRVIEILRSLPVIPLWLGLAAAVPRDWSVERTYFVITLIISLIGWTDLARIVRGRFLQVRHEDFVLAAELAGARPRRLIFTHIMPLFTSHIIAATTLAVPMMIVAETSLSFLGIGLHPPAISWGVMLQQAQNIQVLASSPWLLIPVLPVVIAILAFNFVGDGLRDAADPYE
jgi:peptide/nickel transport system permease protein